MSGVERKNAYAVLGVHKGSSEDQIKQAYVQLVKKYDPESHTERFMIIENAFKRLRDPQKRSREDVLTFNHLGGEYTFADDERVEVPDEQLNARIEELAGLRASGGDPAAQASAHLAKAHMVRAWVRTQTNLIEDAVEDWTAVLGIDPTHQRAKSNLFVAWCSLGFRFANHELYEEAIGVWEKAARMNPDNAAVIHNLALAFEFAGRTPQALRMWDMTLKRWKARLDQDPTDEYMKACLIEGHRHQAEIGEDAGVGADGSGAPGAEPGQTGGGRSDDDDLAAQMEIIRLQPEDFDANFKVGRILMKQKKWKEAARHFNELNKKFPRNIDVMNGLGWALLNSQAVDLAFRTWNQALKLDPKNVEIRQALIRAHMMMGRALRDRKLYINAINHFKALPRFLPDSDEVFYELGRTYQAKGDMKSAYTEFKKALDINPKNKQARVGLSELKIRR